MTRGTVLLWVGALAISGFTLDRILDPFDEGVLLQAGSRIADGQWPYADFRWAYGPGQALLQGAWTAAFEPSVVPWRVLRGITDASVAVLAALLVLPAGRGWALAAGLGAAVTMAQPTSANPTAPAFALALGAVLAATRGRPLTAGILVALAAFWRPDFGAVALLAVVCALLARGGSTRYGPVRLMGAPTARAPVARDRLARPGRLLGSATGAGGRRAGGLRLGDTVSRRAPVARGHASHRDGLRPRHLTRASGAGPPATPAGDVRGGVVRATVAAVAGGLLLYAPFAGAAGPARLWEELVAVSARDGDAWRLSFPMGYDGGLRTRSLRTFAEDAKDALGFHVPLLAVAGLALAAILSVAAVVRARRPGPYHPRWPGDGDARSALAGVLVLAAGALVYFLGRADDLHQQPLVVLACVALPLAATRAPWPSALVPAAAALVGILVLAGAANRVSALLLPPELQRMHLPGVPGIRVPPAEAAALPRVVRDVRRLVPPGAPVYVAPRRSDLVTLTNPLLYALVRRPSVLRGDVNLQARPAEQRRIVAALRSERPSAVIRWLDPASARREPNARGRPSGSRMLDRHLAAAYERHARYGAYEILRLRPIRRAAGPRTPATGRDRAAADRGRTRRRAGAAPRGAG